MRAIVLPTLAALAGPAAAESSLCEDAWMSISEAFMASGALETHGTTTQPSPDLCEITDVAIDMEAQYAPDWHIDRMRITGNVPQFLTGLIITGNIQGLSPGTHRIDVEGIRFVPQAGNAQMDWIFAAQSRANPIDASLAFAWDAAGKTFKIEALTVEFPGDNLVEFSALAKGVDLSSSGAMQMSATGFAVTEADLRIRTHGLFEWYLLMPLGPSFLPYEGDMEAAAEALRAEMKAAVASLPGSSFSDASKAALTALIGELPNPSGVLTMKLRSAAGLGPARLAGYAMTGAPTTMTEVERVFEGTTFDIGWTHEEIP
jgi:hypothetical protein